MVSFDIWSNPNGRSKAGLHTLAAGALDSVAVGGVGNPADGNLRDWRGLGVGKMDRPEFGLAGKLSN